MDPISSFWHPCYGENDTDCHCDWRMTITDCVERNYIFKLFTICLSWNVVLIIPTLSVLYDRLIVKKRVVFERVPHTMFIRPRPIEALSVWMLLFIVCRVIDFAILLSRIEVNPIFQSVFFDLTWEFGLCATTCYVFGLAHTVSNSSEITKRSKFLSRSKVDIGFTVITLVPFLFNTTCSILSGVYVDCIVLAAMTIYFGISILKVFEIHFNNRRGSSDPSVDNVKNSMLRMNAISIVLTGNYLFYAVIKSVYCIGRDEMMKNKTFNVVLCTVWNLVATINVTLVLVALVFSPRLLNPLSFSSNSSGTEAVELSSERLESSLSTETYPKRYEDQKNYYNTTIESARTKTKKKDESYSSRLSISQTKLIPN
ncbi:hypothetical protein BY458DRAFT_216660 [Sporodiniella umbellata]|nr:hypothetical protein BY458DRAFT_216660 [Sporodiniella umbellata]